MKSFESKSVSEEAEFKSKQAVVNERGVLERFQGKAKEIAGVMMMLSVLAIMPGISTEAHAEKKKQSTKIEQVEKKQQNKDMGQTAKKQESRFNEADLTESSRWSLGMMESIRAEAKKIKTREDAVQLLGKGKDIREYFKELYAPTKGKLDKGWFINSREYSREDIILLIDHVKEIDQLLMDFDTKYGINTSEVRAKLIYPIRKDLEDQFIEKAQKNIERLEKTIKGGQR